MRTPFQFTVYYLWKAMIARRTAAIMYTNIWQRFLCIIPNQNGGYEAEPQLLLGEPFGIP